MVDMVVEFAMRKVCEVYVKSNASSDVFFHPVRQSSALPFQNDRSNEIPPLAHPAQPQTKNPVSSSISDRRADERTEKQVLDRRGGYSAHGRQTRTLRCGRLSDRREAGDGLV